MAGRSSSRSSGNGRSSSFASRSHSNSAPQSSGKSSTHNSAYAPVPTANHPPAMMNQTAPVSSSQPGFLSNVLQTATGVAIGHSIGHAITGTVGSLMGGGSSNSPDVSQERNPNYLNSNSNSNSDIKSSICEPHLKSFMDCMDRHHQDIAPCQMYMDMLKNCRGETSISSSNTTPSW